MIPFPYDETYLDAKRYAAEYPNHRHEIFTAGNVRVDRRLVLVRVDVTLPERLTVTGDVHLILMDGCKLDAPRGHHRKQATT